MPRINSIDKGTRQRKKSLEKAQHDHDSEKIREFEDKVKEIEEEIKKQKDNNEKQI